jgi:acid phosphatase family membrane protein YuiD
VLATVVMYDAAGVRRAAGRQAQVLNRIVEDLYQGQPIAEEQLRELLGHTPVEVIVGAVVGFVLTWGWLTLM